MCAFDRPVCIRHVTHLCRPVSSTLLTLTHYMLVYESYLICILNPSFPSIWLLRVYKHMKHSFVVWDKVLVTVDDSLTCGESYFWKEIAHPHINIVGLWGCTPQQCFKLNANINFNISLLLLLVIFSNAFILQICVISYCLLSDYR